MKIMPNILSVTGGKHKQDHDLRGFDVSGSIPSLEEFMCMCFGGTDAKDCFYSALKGMSRSGVFHGSAGPAAFKKPWVCPDSLGFPLFSVHLRASIKFPVGLQSSDNDNAFSTQND